MFSKMAYGLSTDTGRELQLKQSMHAWILVVVGSTVYTVLNDEPSGSQYTFKIKHSHNSPSAL